jgi:protease I
MSKKLSNKKIAVLVADGFEESEFKQPVETLRENGATVDVISINGGRVKSWSGGNWSDVYEVNVEISDARSSAYDAVVLPGGVMNPDKLRTNKQVVDFVSSFFEEGKPVAAICHGPWTLIETGRLKGRKVTSWPSLRTDLINAGAKWEDKEVVVDNGLVTSRKPADLDAFCKKLVEEISEGIHAPA